MNWLIEFPSVWVNSSTLESTFRQYSGPHETSSPEIYFRFPNGCKIMIDAALRLLSLFNQLALCSRRVILDFEEEEYGVMGYLNRAGFFDHLSTSVSILQGRPVYSSAEHLSGTNPRLIEIARINHRYRDEDLPTRMTEALMRACANRIDACELKGAAWTFRSGSGHANQP